MGKTKVMIILVSDSVAPLQVLDPVLDLARKSDKMKPLTYVALDWVGCDNPQNAIHVEKKAYKVLQEIMETQGHKNESDAIYHLKAIWDKA